MEEWDRKWQEGMDAIDQAAVTLERYKHNLNVIQERLDELEEKERKTKWWTR